MLKGRSICKACTFISLEVIWGMWVLLLEEALEMLPQEHHRCIFPVAAADQDQSFIFSEREVPLLLLAWLRHCSPVSKS